MKLNATLEEKARRNESCGMLLLKDGPFAACHSKFDPHDFVEDCVFEYVVRDMDEEALCEALESYFVTCSADGMKMQTWRKPDLCRKMALTFWDCQFVFTNNSIVV